MFTLIGDLWDVISVSIKIFFLIRGSQLFVPSVVSTCYAPVEPILACICRLVSR